MIESVPIPQTWAVKSYYNKPFYLEDLSSNSSEYVNIHYLFKDSKYVRKIERVQNPYQYGKYLMYSLQKNSPAEAMYFMPIASESQLDVALRFNCDYRRLNRTTDGFFNSVSAAHADLFNANTMIVLKGLVDYINHDSGRYPMYVVTYG